MDPQALGKPQGKLLQVMAVDFHPRGTVLATASDDHSVRIWDLRKRRRSSGGAWPVL
jgi:WD40 repeat protein